LDETAKIFDEADKNFDASAKRFDDANPSFDAIDRILFVTGLNLLVPYKRFYGDDKSSSDAPKILVVSEDFVRRFENRRAPSSCRHARPPCL